MTEVKKCKDCKEEKTLGEFDKHSRSADGHAAVCRTCKADSKGVEAEPPKNLTADEKIDRVVESFNGAFSGMNERVSGLETSISEILEAVRSNRAKDNPVSISKGYDAREDGFGEEHEVSFDEVDGESVLVRPTRSVDDPFFKKKEEYEAFMNEPVTVHIAETESAIGMLPFEIGVNGKKEYFYPGQTKTVKRKFVEGLVRARPVHYSNKEVIDREGNPNFVQKTRKSLRHPFSVTQDTARGHAWRKSIMNDPN